MARLKRCVWMIGLMLFLPGAGGPAQAQGPQEGWQMYTNTNYVHDLALEGGGALGGGYTWAATNGGVVCYGASQQVKFTTADGLADNSVGAITMNGGDQLWFGTNGGGASVLDHGGTPFDKDDDAWQTFTTADGLADNDVYAIAADGVRRLWFGTYSGGVSVLNYGDTPFDKGDDTWTTFTTTDGLAGNWVWAIAVDGENWLWFGTWGNGVSVLDHGGTPFYKGDDTWATFTTTHGLASNDVRAIAVDSEKRLWFGAYGGGVSVLDYGDTPFDNQGDTWTTFTTTHGLASNDVWALAVDGDVQLWFGTWGGGVSVLDHGGTPFYKEDDDWQTFTTADDLADNRVSAITVDSARRPWFGTWGDWPYLIGGVSVLDHHDTPLDKSDDEWKTFTTADGLASNVVEAIAVDGGDRLWFGTLGGVSVLDHGGTPFDKGDDTWTTFTQSDGLADNRVEAIAMGGRGRLWFGTSGGVSELVDAVAPVSSAHSPTYTNGKVSVPWSASDGASHIFRVTLWVKHSSSGAWTSTGLSQRGQVTGTFTYTPTHGNGTYSFATVAEDWMGNVEATPTGRGDCSTCVGRCPVYLPLVLRNYRTWDAYYEENDHWLDAYGPLVSGKAYLAYPDDVEDYYYFVLSAPATVNVSVTDFAPTSSNGTVMLYGPAVGDERGPRIDYYGPLDQSSMSLGPHSLGSGKYYVRVNTAQGYSTTQLYRLTVTY